MVTRQARPPLVPITAQTLGVARTPRERADIRSAALWAGAAEPWTGRENFPVVSGSDTTPSEPYPTAGKYGADPALSWERAETALGRSGQVSNLGGNWSSGSGGGIHIRGPLGPRRAAAPPPPPPPRRGPSVPGGKRGRKPGPTPAVLERMDAVRSHLESAGGPVRLSEITSALGFSTIVAKNTLQKMKSLGHVGVEGNTRSASWKLLTEQKGQ